MVCEVVRNSVKGGLEGCMEYWEGVVWRVVWNTGEGGLEGCMEYWRGWFGGLYGILGGWFGGLYGILGGGGWFGNRVRTVATFDSATRWREAARSD